MRTIVVTGASRGLGRALAERFLEAGHRVLACARSERWAQAVSWGAHERASLARVDVADDAAVRAWAEDALERWGAPHLIVNNAARIGSPAPLWEVDAAELGTQLAVNVAAAPRFAPYCATKWAIEGLTRSLAAELPPGLAAVSLNPGVIDTAMLRRVQGDAAASHEGPEAWSRRAAPFLLALGPRDNGSVASIP